MAEKIVFTESAAETAAVFGSLDYNLRFLEKAFGVRISDRGQWDEGCAIAVKGEEEQVERAIKALEHLKSRIRGGEEISEQKLIYVTTTLQRGEEEQLAVMNAGKDCLCLTVKGKPIKAKTAGQKEYAERIRKNTVVLGIGPAGTGKTFLAVAMAVTALRNNQVSRLILTRPAVEAGEKLGYLPGDLLNKIDPYLRPLYDALFEMLGPENYQKQMEKGTIEIAPLAYMRGRTLEDSFIILDEAQNTTPEQMKMFLTRLGNGSKIVVTGDLTQTDLPFGQKSGLAAAVHILKNIDDIAIHEFTDRDVVRHRLVQKIILAYDKYDRERKVKAEEKKEAKRFKPTRG
jgi:phosphate starvation-inducible PhoH-like protein